MAFEHKLFDIIFQLYAIRQNMCTFLSLGKLIDFKYAAAANDDAKISS